VGPATCKSQPGESGLIIGPLEAPCHLLGEEPADPLGTPRVRTRPPGSARRHPPADSRDQGDARFRALPPGDPRDPTALTGRDPRKPRAARMGSSSLVQGDLAGQVGQAFASGGADAKGGRNAAQGTPPRPAALSAGAARATTSAGRCLQDAVDGLHAGVHGGVTGHVRHSRRCATARAAGGHRRARRGASSRCAAPPTSRPMPSIPTDSRGAGKEHAERGMLRLAERPVAWPVEDEYGLAAAIGRRAAEQRARPGLS
jgi:hypothetical protein